MSELPVWIRRTGLVLLFVAGLFFAQGPVLRSGFVGEDYAVLARAAGHAAVAEDGARERTLLWQMGWADFCAVDGRDGSLLSGVSLAISERLWGGPDEWRLSLPSSVLHRLESLVWLLAAALGLRAFLHRLLLPWTGSEQAVAAARASALLLVFHPLVYAAVGALASRGTLMAAAFGTWGAALFLRGRQDRRFALGPVAGLLVCLAAGSDEWALSMPLILAVTELVSSHRYRKLRVRLRTALTTIVVYGAAAAALPLLRWVQLGVRPGETWIASWEELIAASSPWQALPIALEKLGLLIVPASAHSSGLPGTALAGVLFLLALQPALLAARSAPRLWGWLLLWWGLALTLALLPDASTRAHPSNLGSADVLFPAVLFLSVGLGCAATARSGLRRFWMPAATALGYALLSRGNALPWRDAALEVARVRADVEAARELEGREFRVCVIDAPRQVAGVFAVGDDLRWVVDHPPGSLRPPGSAPAVIGPEARAFVALSREREFDAYLEHGLLVVVGGENGERVSQLLGPQRPSTGARSWRGDLRSPDLDWVPWTARALRVTSTGTDAPEQEPRLEWRAGDPISLVLSARGTWTGASRPPVGFFALGDSLPWLLSGRVRRVWGTGGLSAVGEARMLEELPSLGEGMEPDPADRDWTFERPDVEAVATTPGGDYVVGLLDLASLRYLELEVLDGPSNTLLVPDAAHHVAQSVRRTGGPVAWSLDYRVDGVTLARVSGRRIGVRGSREETPTPRQ